MKLSKSVAKKMIAFAIIMLLFVGTIAAVTYYIAYNLYKPTMLTAPTNVSLLDNNILTWDEVQGADNYTIHISSGNDDITLNIFDNMYTINELNKVVYDLSSQIEPDKNYVIAVRANSEESNIENSGYSENYTFTQTE